MEIAERRVGDVLVIAVSGRLTDGGPDAWQFGERVLPLVSGAVEGGHSVVFDFSRLEVIDSIAERAMVMAARKARDAGTHLPLSPRHAHLRERGPRLSALAARDKPA